MFTLLTADGTVLDLNPYLAAAGIVTGLIYGLISGNWSMLLGPLDPSFWEGKPVATDTDNVIQAFNKSAYYPLQALGINFAIALKNGAPLSDSRPAVQQQFTAWIEGTVNSILALAGQPVEQNQPWWFLHNLIRGAISQAGNAANVLQIVKLIDQTTIALASHTGAVIQTNPEPPPPPPPPPPPGPDNTINFQAGFEWFCHQCFDPGVATPLISLATIVTPIIDLIAAPGGVNVGLNKTIDLVYERLTALDPAALGALFEPVRALADCVCPALKSISDSLATGNELQDVPKPLIDQLVTEGAMSAAAGQLLGGSPFVQVAAALLGSVGKYLGGELGEVEHGIGRMLVNVIEPWGRFFLAFIERESDTLWALIKPIAVRWSPIFGTAVTDLLDALGTLESDVPKLVFNFLEKAMTSLGSVTADNVEDTTFRVMGIAWLTGQGIHLLAGLASYIGYPMSSVWGHNASLMVDLLAFDEIRTALHDSFWPSLLGNRAAQHYNSKYPTRIPFGAAGLAMYARRKIDQPTLTKLMLAGGLDPDYETAQVETAYRPMSERILQRLFINRDFPTAIARTIIEDAGIAPANVDFLLSAFEYLSTAQIQRQALIQATTTYSRGIGTLADLDTLAQGMEWGTTARHILSQEATLKIREYQLNKMIAVLAAQVADSIITQDTMSQILVARGMEQSAADFEASVAGIKLATREAVKVQAIARADARAIWTGLSAAAKESYAKGEIDLAALTAGMTAARVAYFAALSGYGIPEAELATEAATTPILIAALVADARERAVLGQVALYGLQLPREDAILLREKVAALIAQFKGTLITIEQLRQSLAALGIDTRNIDALVAKAAVGPLTHHAGSSLTSV